MKQSCAEHTKTTAGCDACRQAKADYQRLYRAKVRSPNTNAAGPHAITRRPIEPIGEWGELRACVGKTYVMFPKHPGGRGNTADWSEARALCRACPATEECWAWVVRNFPMWEIRQSGAMWAGRTPQEAIRDMQAIRRQR